MFKLVRDNIPSKIQRNGEVCNFAQIQNKELLVAFLRDKLIEEVNEFLNSVGGSSDSFEELADIVTVVQALYTAYGVDDDLFKKIYSEKLTSKGGFNSGYIMIIPDLTEEETTNADM